MNHWPDNEALLGRMRDWLEQTQAEVESLPFDEFSSDNGYAEPPAVGLLTLVEEFTALRQEVKLQTKSGRGLEERTASVLDAMQQALEVFRALEPKEAEAAHKAAKPLIGALVDLDESLNRGRSALESAQRRLVDESADQLAAVLAESLEQQSGWRRWACRPWLGQAQAACRRHAETKFDPIFDSLLQGYRLIQTRLRRSLDEQQVQRIDCVGKPADPNTMTVIDLVTDDTQPAGTVVEELRPGYFWKGKLFRYAEVRAVGT